MKMNHIKLTLAFSMLVLLSFSVLAQKTSLLFSKNLLNKTGKSISIELTDSLGKTPVDAVFFNKSDLIFFRVKPIEGQDWNFSKNDSEKKVAEIKMIQDKIVLPAKRLKNLQEKEDIKEIIVSYNKAAINVFATLRFQFEELYSEPVSIPEMLWPNYKKYVDILEKSQYLLAGNDAIGTFRTVAKLWTIDLNFSKFSFYQSSIETFNKTIEKNIAESGDEFQKSLAIFQKNSNEKNLINLVQLKDTLLKNHNEILKFLNKPHEGIEVGNFIRSFESLNQKMLSDVSNAGVLFKMAMLSIFQKKSYEDYKYKLYNELLARLLLSVDKIMPLSSLENIYISKLKKYPLLKNELTDMGWSDDFAIICRLLNDNIHDQLYLFNDTIISHFEKNKASEPQPFYSIYHAFNKLINKEKALFINQIEQCITTVTDRDLLSGMDLSIALATMDSIGNGEFWAIVQKGYETQQNGAFQEAKKYYDKAEKLSISNEVLFFLMGENSFRLNDRYSSEIYFSRALAINPKFILPKLFRIEFLTEDKDYETAVNLVNEAINTNPIWYFYLKKAILFQLQGKNEEAKTILLNNCITLNSHNYDQYIVLGDIYLSLSDVKNARESFMIAGNINPNDKQYKKRMELLKQLSEKPATTVKSVN
ncbi:MAG: hypothetical protein Q8S54_18980 [Bacteroidota bacterium]|nr:hypothetical protein [Bacteroidota bacterium]